MTGCRTGRFVDEARAAGTGVTRVAGSAIADVVAKLLNGDCPVVVAPGLEELATQLELLGTSVAALNGPADSAAIDLSSLDAGVGWALAGVASSGSVVVASRSGTQRHIAFLPRHYVALLRDSTIVEDLASLFALPALVPQPGSSQVMITGPSRTSDIELTPVIGVHGPLRLDVVIIDG